jgi:hypothetical protein
MWPVCKDENKSVYYLYRYDHTEATVAKGTENFATPEAPFVRGLKIYDFDLKKCFGPKKWFGNLVCQFFIG